LQHKADIAYGWFWILIQDIRSSQHQTGSVIFVYHVLLTHLLATFCGLVKLK